MKTPTATANTTPSSLNWRSFLKTKARKARCRQHLERKSGNRIFFNRDEQDRQDSKGTAASRIILRNLSILFIFPSNGQEIHEIGDSNHPNGESIHQKGELNHRFGELNHQFGELNHEFGELIRPKDELNTDFGELNHQFGELDHQSGEFNTRSGDLIQVQKRIDVTEELAMPLDKAKPKIYGQNQ